MDANGVRCQVQKSFCYLRSKIEADRVRGVSEDVDRIGLTSSSMWRNDGVHVAANRFVQKIPYIWRRKPPQPTIVLISFDERWRKLQPQSEISLRKPVQFPNKLDEFWWNWNARNGTAQKNEEEEEKNPVKKSLSMRS